MMLLILAAFADPLPDLASTLSRASCESPPSAMGSHPGAEQFYTGAFKLDEEGVLSGEERRYTFPNRTWSGKGGNKCVDVWKLRGRKTDDIDDCPSCDFGIYVKGDIDSTKTTCSTRLTANGNHFRTTYGVKEKDDGSFELVFLSGKYLGAGEKTEGAYSWKSKQTCIWL